MLDTSKVRTYTPRSYPQDSAGQASHISTQFGQVSDALLSLKEHADEVDSAANAVEARVTTAESNISALDAREAADKAELDADVATLTSDLASEASTRGSADTALDGRVTTIEGAYAHKGANTDITSLNIDELDVWSITIPYPENSRTYPVKPYVRFAATAQYVRAFTDVGTATVNFKKNGSSLGAASAISATTSSTSTTTITSGNTVASGDNFTVVPTSADTAEYLTVEIWYSKKIPG